MKPSASVLSVLHSSRLATIPCSVALLLLQTFHGEILQAHQIANTDWSLSEHHSITLPPPESNPNVLDPNGAYYVNLEDSPNHSEISPARQEQIMTEAREEQFHFFPRTNAPGTFQASNHAHNLEFTHTADGLTITPRPSSVNLLNPAASPEWSVQYRASALVLDGFSSPFESNPPSAFENQSSTNRLPGCREWFINSNQGLQQGFTIQQPPGDQPNSLAVQIDINSNLSPSFEASSQSIEFRDSNGRTLLHYRNLHVFDHAGRELPSRMELDTSGTVPAIILQTDVLNAQFPITVDPFTSVQQGANQMPVGLAPGDGFGSSSAGRGDHSAIGAPDKGNGVVYLYHRNEGGTDNFGQIGTLEVPEGEPAGTTDQFGSTLVFTEDETSGKQYLLVGAQQHGGCGSVFVYHLDGSDWTFLKRLQPSALTSDALFGCSISAHGTMIAVGARAHQAKGAVFIYKLDSEDSEPFDTVADFQGAAGDDFGHSVSLYGTTLIVGVPGRTVQDDPLADGEEGDPVSYTRAGVALVFTALLLGGPFGAGYAQFFNDTPGSNQQMGLCVLAFKDIIVIGIPGAAKVVIWRQSGLNWSQIGFLKGPAASLFGYFMTINSFGDLAVSAPLALVAGLIYLFLFNQSTNKYPSSGEVITPSNPDPGMRLGNSFFLIGRLLFAMAPNYFFGQGAFFRFLLTASAITFATWLLLYFESVQINDPGQQHLFGFFGDFDRDGIPNFVEYLLGLHPKIFDRDPLTASIANGIYQIFLSISLVTLNALFLIQYSFNMSTWFTLGTGLLLGILTTRIHRHGINRDILLLSMPLAVALSINPNFFLRYYGSEQ